MINDDPSLTADVDALVADQVDWTKPALQFSVPCLTSHEDEEGSLHFGSIFVGLDAERPADSPDAEVTFSIVNGWTNGIGHYMGGVRIVAPDDSIVYQQERPVILKNRAIRHAVEHGVHFPIRQSGYHRVQVTLDGDVVLEYLMKVTLVES